MVRRAVPVVLCLISVFAVLATARAQMDQPAPSTPAAPATAEAPAGPPLTRIAPNAPLPPMSIQAAEEMVAPDARSFSAEGHVVITGGREFLLKADHVSGDLETGITAASGHLYMRELGTTITGSSGDFNLKNSFGIFTNVTVAQRALTISADTITIQPSRALATGASFSTCPPGLRQDYHIQARTLVYEETSARVTAIDAGLYLGRTRIAHLHYITFQLARPGHARTLTQTIRQQFGYNRFDGAYLGLGASPRLFDQSISVGVILPTRSPVEASATTLIPIKLFRKKHKPAPPAPRPGPVALFRQFAQGKQPILPPGDPLMFHNFGAPSPFDNMLANEGNSPAFYLQPNLDIRQRIFGKSVANLTLSRLPELNLLGYIPLAGQQNLPQTGNPEDVRRALRKVALQISLDPSVGYYHEYPDGVHQSREAFAMSLGARPLLIGTNTLFIPRLGVQSNTYSGNSTYHYWQGDLAVERFFTDRDAFGVDYIRSSVGGTSPFIFDSLVTSQELDVRGQVGNRHHIVNVLLRYDLNRGDLFEWDVTYGHVMHCLVPTITYDSQSRNLGFGLNIEGVNF